MESQRSRTRQLTSLRSERLWVFVFATSVMLVTTIPYLVGYSVVDENWQFTGFVLSVEDGNGFIGKMLSGTVGEWLFRTPYTALPQRGFIIFLPYLLLGKLVSPPGTHEALVALYHVFRICSGVLAIFATYEFLSFFIARVRYRRYGLALATLGGGLGWILLLLDINKFLGSLPLEFYSPESFGFLSLYIYPHYALARALLLWGLVAYLRAANRLNGSSIPRQGLKVGVLWLLAGLAQPLTGMVVGAVVGIYLLTLAARQLWLSIKKESTAWSRLGRMTSLALWAGLVPAPFVLYNLVYSQVDPFMRMWTAQSTFKSPHPLHYLLAYGLLLPFALVGAKQLWRAGDWAAKLPVAWALFLPVLAYAPTGMQRRLPEGIWVSFVVLAVKALESMIGQRLKRIDVVLLLAFPSTIMLLVGGALLVSQPSEPAFRPSDEVLAFQHLAQQSSRDTVVLSSYETGNALPAWVPAFVVVGHGPESIGLAELMPRVAAFFRAETPTAERLELLTDLDIDYVFWGPHEQAVGEWDPKTADFLSLSYHHGDYWIFAVNE